MGTDKLNQNDRVLIAFRLSLGEWVLHFVSFGMKWNSSLYDSAHDFVSRYGEGLLPYLSPQPGEMILDLGCGTADLTKQISDAGATVIGVDNAPEMIERAKSKYPELDLRVRDGRDLNLNIQFDAIFSNAVLHWIPEKEVVIQQMYSHLKQGGRIAVEFGGKGNNKAMLAMLRTVLDEREYPENAAINFWYYPSIAEYAGELESAGFRVVLAEHFDRLTPLKGVNGIKEWFYMFGESFFEGVPEPVKEDILNEVQERLAPTNLVEGVWSADYKRIRIVAVKE